MFGILGFLGGIASAAIGIVSGVVSTIGSVAASVARTIISIAPTMEKIVIFRNVITAIAQVLGILNPEEDTEEIGAKVMQEDTRPRMPNESAEDYLNYLRMDVELEREKKDQMDEKDRMACIAMGSALTLETLSEKGTAQLTPEFVMNASKTKLAPEHIIHIASSFEKNQIGVNKFNDYFENKLNGNDLLNVNTVMKESIKEIHPDMTDKEIRNEIYQMKMEIQKEDKIEK